MTRSPNKKPLLNVLLMDTGHVLLEQLQELSNGVRIKPYVACSQTEALRILACHQIDKVIFTVRTLADLEFLKYLNTSYQQTEVIVLAEETVREIVAILRYGKYQVLPPLPKLSALKACLNECAIN
jgi:hypothetical protein